MALEITLKSVRKSFMSGTRSVDVLGDISVSFQQGTTYALTGASGTGKSTLLSLIGTLDSPTSGQVLYNGQDCTTFSSAQLQQLRRKELGFVFQFHYLIKELTVSENVLLPGVLAGSPDGKRGAMLLEKLGLADCAHAYPAQLSGGQQQRVAIARALYSKPKFILADEPTGNLDEESAAQVAQLFLSAQKEWGMGLIICSHDPAVYEQMQTIYLLREGTLHLAKEPKAPEATKKTIFLERCSYEEIMHAYAYVFWCCSGL